MKAIRCLLLCLTMPPFVIQVCAAQDQDAKGCRGNRFDCLDHPNPAAKFVHLRLKRVRQLEPIRCIGEAHADLTIKKVRSIDDVRPTIILDQSLYVLPKTLP